MSEKQKGRAKELIRQMVADLLMRRVKDPRVSEVSIIDVDLSADYSVAKIYYNIVGGSASLEEVQKGLESCKSFIRIQLKKGIRLRVIPDLVFQYDETLDRAMAIEELIHKIHDEEDPPEGEEPEDG
jgi:ribosome-binding factor A